MKSLQVKWILEGIETEWGEWRAAVPIENAIASYRFVLAAAKRAAKSKMLGVLNSSGSKPCHSGPIQDFDRLKKWMCGQVSFIWCAIQISLGN